jgi:hypothetical protein
MALWQTVGITPLSGLTERISISYEGHFYDEDETTLTPLSKVRFHFLEKAVTRAP